MNNTPNNNNNNNLNGNDNGNMQQSNSATTAIMQSNNNELMDEQYEPREHYRITKNVVIIGMAFMIHFTAFHGTANLQSSVNSDAALGTTTLAVMYGSLILSNIFLPMTVISWFGVKLTMALAFIAYMPFIAAQFMPSFYTLLPAGFFVGFGGGPLWCAKCTYLSTVAEALTRVRNNESHKDVNTVKFFGLFFIFYQMAQVWGNLVSSTGITISYLLLSLSSADNNNNNNNNSVALNNLLNKSVSQVSELCGARFCPDFNNIENPNLSPPEPEQIQLLNSIFLICMALAVTCVLFGVDSLKRYETKQTSAADNITGCRLLLVTLSLLRKRRQLLILPITMFIGLEEAFLAVDFTRSFVACGWGISKIGFAMIAFGVANAIAAGLAGSLVERMGRISLAVICALLNFALLLSMYFYVPQDGDYKTYFTFAAVWGICDGVWLVIINAFYGILFPKQLIACYSNFRLWESTGSVIGYIISSQLCTSTKLVILICVLMLGCTGYGICEWRLRRRLRTVEIMLN